MNKVNINGLNLNIIKYEVINCYISNVIEKAPTFSVVKISECNTNEFLFSYGVKSCAAPLKSLMGASNVHTILKLEIESETALYRLNHWDDVEKGLCPRKKVKEVRRDGRGKPIEHHKITVYAFIDNDKDCFTIEDYMHDRFIAVNDKNVWQYLQYDNQQSYQRMLLERNIREQSRWEEEPDDIYYDADEALAEQEYRRNMSEEDRIMDALENGDAECYGF